VSDREEAVARREKARALGRKARERPGRDIAAGLVLDLAKTGYEDEVLSPSENNV